MVDALPKGIVVQYVGFQDVAGRREYALQVQCRDESYSYVVWIELAAFSRGHFLLQDGPDICYQRLLRELAGPELGSARIQVTEGELVAYREAHAPPSRRGGFSPPRPVRSVKAPPLAPPGSSKIA